MRVATTGPMLARAAFLASIIAPGCTLVLAYEAPVDEIGAERCADSDDNDLDGLVDCAEDTCTPLCAAPVPPPEPPEVACPLGWDEVLANVPDGLGPVARCQVDDATLLGSCDPVVPPDAIHVAPGGDGDGSSTTRPLGSITAALAAASDGGTVALGAGTYAEAFVVGRAVTLLGSCDATRLEVGELRATADLSLSHLTVVGAVTVGADARLSLRRVELTSAGPAIRAETGARVTIERAVVLAGPMDRALTLDRAATARLSDVRLAGGVAAISAVDARVELVRVVTAGALVLSGPLATLGGGPLVIHTTGLTALLLEDEATASVAGLEVRAEGGDGVIVRDGATRVQLSDVVIEAAMSAVRVGGGARFSLERAVVIGASGSAVEILGSGTEGTLRDVRVAGVAPRGDGARATTEDGIGVEVADGAVVSVVRAAIVGARAQGFSVSGRDTGLATSATLTDVSVRRVGLAGCTDGLCDAAAYGVGGGEDATATISGFIVERTNGCGVRLGDRGVLALEGGALLANIRALCVPTGVRPLDYTGAVVFRDNFSDYMIGTRPGCFMGISANCNAPFLVGGDE